MIAYYGSAYSNAPDIDTHMKNFMKASGLYMLKNPSHYLVSPLFNHPTFKELPSMNTNWTYWKDYSIALLRKSDIMIVYKTEFESIGLQAEIGAAKMLNIPVVYIRLDENGELEILDSQDAE